MVIPSPASHMANIGFVYNALTLSLSILTLLSSTAYSEPNGNIKSATFMSEMFEIGPGKVREKTLWNIEFPRGHIGVKSFDAEIVDEEGSAIPLYETYLHHWFAIKYHVNMSYIFKNPMDLNGTNWQRNEGTCNGYMLPHYWGLGTESRGTTSKIPCPFSVEVGNPPKGFEERWLFNIMVIDTRGTQDRKGCTECRCNLMDLPKDFYNTTMGIDGKPLRPDYKGGFFCCKDEYQCKLNDGFKAPTRKLALRYKITWVNWDQNQIPVRFYILDSTDRVKTNGSQIIHDCQAEYTIPEKAGSESIHVQRENIPMVKGGCLIYATSHLHTGVVNAIIYRQDGKELCTSTPKYGTGKEPGNENGYVVGVSGCYPKPGSVHIKNGEVLTFESRYKNEFLTGAMGHMYIYLADRFQ